MSRWLSLAFLTLALIAPSAGRAQEKIAIPSRTPTTVSEFLGRGGKPATVAGYLYMPANAKGPVPALILKHGSAGLDGPQGDNIRRWAQDLNRWGVAAFVVDSFGPRGLSGTGGDQGKLREFADLVDSFAGLKALAADPRIDAGRIGIMGWSRGGSIAMETALESARLAVLAPADPTFAAHIVFYGAAEPQYRDHATDRAPMLFLHGLADDLVPVGPTQEYADWIKTMGNRVTFHTYPGAYHDFDVAGGQEGFVRGVESARKCDVVTDFSTGQIVRLDHKPVEGVSGLKVLMYMRGCLERGATLRADPAARADAVDQVHAFLVETFRIPG